MVCTDDVHLFVPHPQSPDTVMMNARQGYPFFIECRPTHPDVEMTLWRGSSNRPESSRQIQTGHNVTYHPHTGFYVRSPNLSYQGQLYCQAVLNATRKFFSFFMFVRREYR